MNKKNLGIKIDIEELNDKAQYEGGTYFIFPIFIDKKDYSRANIIHYFLKVANELSDKLKLEDIKLEKIYEYEYK